MGVRQHLGERKQWISCCASAELHQMERVKHNTTDGRWTASSHQHVGTIFTSAKVFPSTKMVLVCEARQWYYHQRCHYPPISLSDGVFSYAIPWSVKKALGKNQYINIENGKRLELSECEWKVNGTVKQDILYLVLSLMSFFFATSLAKVAKRFDSFHYQVLNYDS